MTEHDTKVGDLCKELGVTRQTLYRFVGPKGDCDPTARSSSSEIVRKPTREKVRNQLPCDTPVRRGAS